MAKSSRLCVNAHKKKWQSNGVLMLFATHPVRFSLLQLSLSLDAQKMYRELTILLELRGNPLFAQLEDVMRADGDKDLFCVFERMESDLHRGLSALSGTVIHRRYIMYQVVTAMRYLHSAKIVHRDLKPSNILINWDNCHVRLCDFGLARSIAPGCEASDSGLPLDTLTSYVATRWYRAPELIFGSSLYDGSVDVWAIGCIMGEMIRGKPMFPSNSTLEQLEKVLELTGLPSDLSHLKSESAKDLLTQLEGTKRKGAKIRDVADMLGFCSTNEEIDFVSKCLEFHPSKRATMEQLLNHPYFTPIRNIEFELVAPKYIRIPLDDEGIKRSVDEYKEAIFQIVANLDKVRKVPLLPPTTADTEDTAGQAIVRPDSSVVYEEEYHADYEDGYVDEYLPIETIETKNILESPPVEVVVAKKSAVQPTVANIFMPEQSVAKSIRNVVSVKAGPAVSPVKSGPSRVVKSGSIGLPKTSSGLIGPTRVSVTAIKSEPIRVSMAAMKAGGLPKTPSGLMKTMTGLTKTGPGNVKSIQPVLQPTLPRTISRRNTGQCKPAVPKTVVRTSTAGTRVVRTPSSMPRPAIKTVSAVSLARSAAAGLNRSAAARKASLSRSSKEALFYQREVDELVASQIPKPSDYATTGIIPPLKFYLLEQYRGY